VRRQDGSNDLVSRRFETFSVDVTARTTLTDALRAIDRRPVTTAGNEVSPVAWEGGCFEGACGACTLLVDGIARVACTTRIRVLPLRKNTVTLEPLRAFPVIRDLIVDRSRMFGDFARSRAWVDGVSTTVGGDREGSLVVPRSSTAPPLGLDRCTSCAVCLDACPEYGGSRPFWGPAVLLESERLRERVSPEGRKTEANALLAEGGIAGCGQSGNCEEVCPEGIPLVEMLARAARATTAHVFDWLTGKSR
jgi:succinate dehydrogenase / fumarate reductase iron-sulfur subunit